MNFIHAYKVDFSLYPTPLPPSVFFFSFRFFFFIYLFFVAVVVIVVFQFSRMDFALYFSLVADGEWSA